MVWWRNTSSLSSCDCRSDQVSAPHRSRFIGMALKKKILVVEVKMGIAPYFVQASHGGICCSKSCSDVIVVT